MRIGDAVDSYEADEAVWRTRTQVAWLLVFLAALALLPAFASSYVTYLAALVGIAVISATGLNILTGYTGLISLGQAAFMGIGAYSVAVLAPATGLPFFLVLPLAGLIAAAVGVVVGLPSLRVKGLYLAIATLAASVLAHFVFVHWEQVTGGIRGLNIAPATLAGIELDTTERLYYLIMTVAVIMVLAARNLFRTRVGRAFIAIRDRDISAEVLGIDLLKYKLMSFGLSSFYAGLAGGLWMYFFRVVTPESFPISTSVFYLAAIIVGGMGTILGAILGAAFMTLMPEALKLLAGLVQPYYVNAPLILSPMRDVVFGALIVGFLLFEPHGLAEIWRRVRRHFHLWPFRT